MDSRLDLLMEMEQRFDNKDEEYFKNLVNHKDLVIRTRAVCILADISGEKAIEPIGQVLLNDSDQLVRHEAAFSLGQLGSRSGIEALSKAVLNDPSFFVRHEAAVALGVIGSEECRKTLEQALNDESEEVKESAMIALANLDYISHVKRTNKFTSLTGG
ncbi:MAG TPA: HEAT repeat domain-containing protein [Candidatus Saccharimonadales bacterium]|nr:HEAT repeat domain-containing protein [Candidatus Saccharimonadales bacterium]